MNFRNATIFRFPSTFEGLFQSSVADAFDELADRLADAKLKPVGPLEICSRGFVSPYGHGSDLLVQRIDNVAGICVASETRLLPPAVIASELQRRCDAIEQQDGRSPGPRQRKHLKDDVVTEFLPRAFVQPGRTDAYFDFGRRIIVVDSSSRKAAETVVSEVRHAAGTFPALPLNAETSPRGVLTGWLSGDELPKGLSLGDECELRDPTDRGAVIRVQNLELSSEDVQAHIASGLQCSRLALVLEDRICFVVGEDLGLRKIKMLDGALDDLAGEDREDVQQELDARFVILTAEIGRVFDLLEAAFHISSLDEQPEPKAAVPPKRGRKQGALKGISTVTISGPGMTPVTLSADEFAGLADNAKQFGEMAKWVRTSGKTTISALQRRFRLGYNRAARVIEALESVGVLSRPDASGSRQLINKEAM